MLSIRTKSGIGSAKVGIMIIKQDIVEVNRASLLVDPSTPYYVIEWFAIADNKKHDPTDLANCARVFAKVLETENKCLGDNHAR